MIGGLIALLIIAALLDSVYKGISGKEGTLLKVALFLIVISLIASLCD